MADEEAGQQSMLPCGAGGRVCKPASPNIFLFWTILGASVFLTNEVNLQMGTARADVEPLQFQRHWLGVAQCFTMWFLLSKHAVHLCLTANGSGLLKVDSQQQR